MACPNSIKYTGIHFIRQISKLYPKSSVCCPHLHNLSVTITQQGSPSQHQGPIEILLQPHEIHSTPNRGKSGVCIIIFHHLVNGIYYVLSVIFACIQGEHKGIQVPHIFPYIGVLAISTQYHYN